METPSGQVNEQAGVDQFSGRPDKCISLDQVNKTPAHTFQIFPGEDDLPLYLLFRIIDNHKQGLSGTVPAPA